MEKYYVNDMKEIDGNFEVHKESCEKLPDIYELTFLGEFSNAKFALTQAKKMNLNPIPCQHCSLTTN